MVGQALIWFQTNSQFLWPWAKDNPFILAMCGLPISYILIIATRYVVAGFDGLLWPGRMLGFGSGMVVMVIFTWLFMGEGVNMKTATSLLLATILVMVQVMWK